MKIKDYIAVYFKKTNKIISSELKGEIITMQFFQRSKEAKLAGMEEVLILLNKNTNTSKYKIKFLKDGSLIKAKEVVLELEGEYKYFGIYEGIIDSILARSTSIATNAYRLTQLTKKPIIYMGDRSDYYLNQKLDGKAAAIGGIKTQVTDAQVKVHSGKAVGTVPHALIQAFGGDLIKALEAYHKNFPTEKLTALVDFNNDVITDSIRALKRFKKDLGAVRVDTPQNMTDKMFSKNEKEYGVTPLMIKRLRKALDDNDGKHVKIIASSGIDEERVKLFEKEKAPIDIYGIGSSITKINIGFTADAVKLNGKNLAKAGRKYRENKKLMTYK